MSYSVNDIGLSFKQLLNILSDVCRLSTFASIFSYISESSLNTLSDSLSDSLSYSLSSSDSLTPSCEFRCVFRCEFIGWIGLI